MAAETPPPPDPDSLGAAIAEVSERMSVLVREEIELAKAEMTTKVTSIARGTVAVLIGAVFGVFALIFGLGTLAWGIASITNYPWIGFGVVFVVLLLLTVFAFLFAWRKLKVGAPTPKMAIDEGRKIRATVAKDPS